MPATAQFTELGLHGAPWKFVFSSMRTVPQGSVRLRHLEQRIGRTPNNIGYLVNRVLWSFESAENDGATIHAELLVRCTFTFVGAVRMEVKLQAHEVRFLERKDGKKINIPSNMDTLVVELQRALPMEFFDPSGLIEVTFLEPQFRIVRFLGKRIAGVRNVFTRDAPLENDASADVKSEQSAEKENGH